MANDVLQQHVAILAMLADAQDQTLFAPQVRASVAMNDESFEAAITTLEAQHQIVIEAHSAPDPHLPGDWRSISLVTDVRSTAAAADAGRAYFNRWVREFLQQHRCT